jgi:hypothetical protein
MSDAPGKELLISSSTCSWTAFTAQSNVIGPSPNVDNLTWVCSSLICKYQAKLQRLVKDKHSSFSSRRKMKKKKFHNICRRGQYYRTFTVVSYEFLQAFPA